MVSKWLYAVFIVIGVTWAGYLGMVELSHLSIVLS